MLVFSYRMNGAKFPLSQISCDRMLLMRRYPNLSGIICLIVISSISLPLLAMSAQGHNKDIGYILYGYSTWSDFEENATEDEKHSYYRVTDASVFAIDE